jgi:hypothetical protein
MGTSTGNEDGVMKKTTSAAKKPTRLKPQAQRRPVTAGGRRRTTLGYAQDAGHPGGLQDLRAKTDTEAEHDVWQRHG